MSKLPTLILAALAGVATATPRWAFADDPGTYGYGPHMMGWGGEGWGMVLGPLFMILVLAVVIAAVVLLIRWLGGPTHHGSWHHHHMAPGRTALDILKERFARGEIDKAEFEERRRALGE